VFKTFTGTLGSTFAVLKALKIPPHLKFIATLPCNLLSEDNSNTSVAVMHLRCGVVFNDRFIANLLQTVPAKEFGKSQYMIDGAVTKTW